MNIEETNLERGFKKFINAMRLFVYAEMKNKYNNAWERKYFETLNTYHQKAWNTNRNEVKNVYELIDFGNLSGFAKKTNFFTELVKNGWKYYTKFNDINEARNMIAHYAPFDNDKANLAFAQMISIAKELEMDYLKNDLRLLQNNKVKEIAPTIIEKPNQDKTIRKQRPKIKKVISFLNNKTGLTINKNNANLSTINKNGIYSVEPNFGRKNGIWHLILINTNKKTIYFFNVPKNHSIYSRLYTRDDKEVFRLLFDIDDKSFTEKMTNEKFDVFLEKECNYEDDGLIF
ncbi:Swt1 family HEPN domain-containing protein [uncultured Polaribacter sp.]|uniref:Swt1 family HEPN domain-containing protein n=1 Tax=uncultured Polaribacter sp. TaxID=174711 RepID=UPI00259BF052|nr:Swt1 family HEPN domain-containing protein [uncultured Polaribacter sp.]